MLTKRQHQEWKKDLEELNKLRGEKKKLRQVLGSLHFCRCGCCDDNIKSVEQVLEATEGTPPQL